ncbi:hypothetical protein ScPMuIL_005796 [Solemya velum]
MLCDRPCGIEHCSQCSESGETVVCVQCDSPYTGSDCSRRCPENCESCTSLSECTECESGFHGETCDEICPDHCIECTSGTDCGRCEDGWYTTALGSSIRGCSQCSEGCMNCTSGTTCEECYSGWFYRNYKCSKCPSQCLLCSDHALCQRCEPGWYVDITPSESQCATCPDQCTDCDSMDDCTTCQRGWAGPRCQCSENCDGGLKGCDQNTGRCTAGCVQNYYGDSCDVQCDACLTCNQSTGVCTSCRHGYFGLQCNETCSWGCSESPDGEVDCDMRSGRCLTPCVTGYRGDTCSVLQSRFCNTQDCYRCTKGTYGEGCGSQCDGRCDSNGCGKYSGNCFRCDDGYWGDTCSSLCPVGCSGSRCDQVTGSCGVCVRGWTGDRCDVTCPSHCDDQGCDKTNGTCVTCDAGRYGETCTNGCTPNCDDQGCDRVTGNCVACDTGWYGHNCVTPCQTTCDIQRCDRARGVCVACDSGWYGDYCSSRCPSHCLTLDCDKYTGNCSSCQTEWTGPRCDTRLCTGHCLDDTCDDSDRCINCSHGYWGIQCSRECGTHCGDDGCNRETAVCTGCDTGRHGARCQDACSQACVGGCGQYDAVCNDCVDGFYGGFCNLACNINCNVNMCHQNGTCTDGCAERWTGPMCDRPCGIDHCSRCRESGETVVCVQCDSPYTGSDCSQRCPENCVSYQCTDCDSMDDCTTCQDGWAGPRCQCNENCEGGLQGCDQNAGRCKVGCVQNYYGDSCDVQCDVCLRCDQSTGVCTSCRHGYFGLQCNETWVDDGSGDDDVAVGVGVGVGFLVLTAVVILLFLVLRRRRRRSSSGSDKKSDLPLVTPTHVTDGAVNLTFTEEEDVDAFQPLSRTIRGDLASVSETGSSSRLTSDVEGRNEITRASLKAPLGQPPTVIQIEEQPSSVVLVEEQLTPVVTSPPNVEYCNISQSKPIDVDKLMDHVLQMKAEGVFAEEHDDLPKGLVESYEEAGKVGNRGKCRFKSIYPYDHSRVVLDLEESKPDSDFINACYVDGYDRDKAYVAAQGPVDHTLKDFWRMVWQLDSGIIVMLTNLTECGQMKCVQYWPNPGAPHTYGSVATRLMEEEEFANFTVRTLGIRKKVSVGKNPERIIKQFHFTTWPDKGVPKTVTALIDFRNKVCSTRVSGQGPYIVHCSAGIGRTGTFIGLDFLISQGQGEKRVDVFNAICKMRHQRTHLVQTNEQYEFLYDALVEALHASSSMVPSSDFNKYYLALKETVPGSDITGLQQQFQTIQRLSNSNNKSDHETANQPDNKQKNRYSNILAADSYRVILGPDAEDNNSYINAVFLPGYKQRRCYILTETPQPNTVTDFWKNDLREIVFQYCYDEQ